MPLVDGSSVRVVTDSGPWKPVAAEEEIGGPWRVAHGGFERTLEPVSPRTKTMPEPVRTTPVVTPAVIQVPALKGPTLAIPGRRARKDARPVGKKVSKSPAQLARDHFVDYPTRVKAARLTIYLPPELAKRARLTGDDVDNKRPARRTAVGDARLVLGELSLEAGRIVLRTRSDGREDLQIMARGDVEFVSEVRGNILREHSLRSLLITNDQVVPLR